MRAVLLLLLAAGARCYIEVLEESHCHDSEFRLTCRHLQAHLAIMEATFNPNTSCANPEAGNVSIPNAKNEKRHVRLSLNRRCSGVNHCSFLLVTDHKPAASWGPGLLFVKYACIDGGNLSKLCTGDHIAHGEGFLQTPGYPQFYVGENECKWTVRAPPGQRVQLQLLDVSLREPILPVITRSPEKEIPVRITYPWIGGGPEPSITNEGIGPTEINCTDQLTVTENDRILLSTCGDEDDLIQILSDGNVLDITITVTSKTLFPKRGVLLHYKAIGCVHPPLPQDGYLVYKNDTFGEYMCCVGFVFPDTLQKTRVLQCINNNTWNNSLPNCANKSSSIWGPLRLHSDINTTNYEMASVVKESDLMFDVLLPTVIICILLVGNGVILYVIYYLRKRKSPRSSDDEVGAICQPDGSERAISV